jgi:UDP-4-amino-4,6-dideoxy-N-acetyl-beta-L-altrosamine transaminase
MAPFVIPYGRQDISDPDVEAVARVLRSDWLTQGPAIPEFERAVAERCQVPFATAFSSATAALHIAARALGVGPGDVVWTVPNSFVASANCALYCGASVDFVDIDERSYNMDPAALEKKLRDTKAAGKTLPKVIIPVHFSGQPCDRERIATVARRYGCAIVEDASHAIGATRNGTPIGDCTHADLVVFSFHPVKIITTAEGGMVMAARAELHEKVQLLRSHGITRDTARMQRKTEGAWYYEQIDLGFNYRMTDVQAALGTSQMSRLDEFLLARRRLAARYDTLLSDLPLRRPWRDPAVESAWHLYVIRLESERHSRREVFDALRAAGIGVNVHYIPIHLQPYYRELGFKPGDFPVSEWYYDGAITIPMYATLTDEQQDTVVAALREALA